MSTLKGDPTTDHTIQGDGVSVTSREFSWPGGEGRVVMYSARPEEDWTWFQRPQVAWRDADAIRQGIRLHPWGVAKN